MLSAARFDGIKNLVSVNGGLRLCGPSEPGRGIAVVFFEDHGKMRSVSEAAAQGHFLDGVNRIPQQGFRLPHPQFISFWNMPKKRIPILW